MMIKETKNRVVEKPSPTDNKPPAGEQKPAKKRASAPSGGGRKASPAATDGSPCGADTGKTVAYAVTKIGEGLLKCRPDLKAVYMTSDGRGFYEKTDADNHAQRLNNNHIITIEK